MHTELQKVQRATEDYKGNQSVQTGFSSPATHYREPVIDLNKELSASRDATFFMRVQGDAWKAHNILNEDVLIIDKSVKPTNKELVLVILDDEFTVKRASDIQKTGAILWGTITYIIHKAV